MNETLTPQDQSSRGDLGHTLGEKTGKKVIPFKPKEILGDPNQPPPSEENNWGGYGSKKVMEYVCLHRYEALDRLDPL